MPQFKCPCAAATGAWPACTDGRPVVPEHRAQAWLLEPEPRARGGRALLVGSHSPESAWLCLCQAPASEGASGAGLCPADVASGKEAQVRKRVKRSQELRGLPAPTRGGAPAGCWLGSQAGTWGQVWGSSCPWVKLTQGHSPPVGAVQEFPPVNSFSELFTCF